jgi:hypothetical protein
MLGESGPPSAHISIKSVIALMVDSGVGAMAPLFIYIVFLVIG